jgi:bla regulator protein blaR1
MALQFKTLIAAALITSGAFAQDIAGTWQGTVQTPQRAMRFVVKITRTNGESLKAVFYSIDQSGQGASASSVSFQGGTFKATIAAVGANYEGKLSADGNAISGSLTQGSSLPLNLVKATPSTEWAIPEAPPPPRSMPADAKPTFEVSTIKPSAPDSQGQSILVGRGGGNSFTTTNTPLTELIKFAYGLHARQVTGGPSWAELEKWDILAKPDTPGGPNLFQLQSMVQKLLADRFGLVFHREKREISAYVITADKSGVKMTKVETNRGNLPGFGGRGLGVVGVQNSTMMEFAQFLQSRVLDRPVVDQTGLTDRYDFTLEWRPDVAQLGPNPPALPQNVEDRPDLIAAMRQQLGLKIESTKAPVEVLVIDKVTKPTEN